MGQLGGGERRSDVSAAVWSLFIVLAELVGMSLGGVGDFKLSVLIFIGLYRINKTVSDLSFLTLLLPYVYMTIVYITGFSLVHRNVTVTYCNENINSTNYIFINLFINYHGCSTLIVG